MRSREARRHGDLETRRPGDKKQEVRSKKYVFGYMDYVNMFERGTVFCSVKRGFSSSGQNYTACQMNYKGDKGLY